MDYLTPYMKPQAGVSIHSQQFVLRAASSENSVAFRAWAVSRIDTGSPEEMQERVKRVKKRYEDYQEFLQLGDKVFSTTKSFVKWVLKYGLSKAPPVGIPQKLIATGIVMGLDKVLDWTLKEYRASIDGRTKKLLGNQMQSLGMTEDDAKVWSRDIQEGKKTWEDFSKELFDGDKDERLLVGFSSDSAKQVGRSYLRGMLEKTHPDPLSLFQAGLQCQLSEDQKAFQGQLEAIQLQQKEAAANLQGLQADMEKVNTKIEAMAKAQDAHTDDLAFLKDFAYSRMTPEEKLALLQMKDEKGRPLHFPHMKDRKGAEELLGIQVNIVGRAQKYLNGAQMIGDILESQFKVKVPKGVKTALKVGTALTETATALLSQNYLGAAVAICGLFSKKGPDPAEIRHQQIMDAFQDVLEGQAEILANQEEMKGMLNNIIDNQAQLLGAIQDLGRLVVSQHEKVMMKLDQIHRDLLWTRRLVAETVEQDIRTALTFVEVLQEQEGFDFENGEFHSLKGMRRAFQKRMNDFTRGTQGFDNALRLDNLSNIFLIASHGHDLPEDQPEDRPYRAVNREFVTKYYRPAWNILMTMVGESALPDWMCFSLTRPAAEVTALLLKEQAIQEVDDTGRRRIDCIEVGAPVRASILAIASGKMKEPLHPAKVIEYGDVLAVFHAFHPFIKNTSPVEIYSPKELAELPHPSTEGLEMIERMLVLVDLTFAQVGLISGEGILPRLLELYSETSNERFLKGVERWDLISKTFEQLLFDNSYLRLNFAKAFCSHALTTGERAAYRMAYESDNPLSLEALFNEPSPESAKWIFEKKEVENQDHEKELRWHATVVVDRHGKKIIFPQFILPTPEERLDLKMCYPSDFSSLLDTRQRLIDAWLSYHSEKIWADDVGDYSRKLMIRIAYDQ